MEKLKMNRREIEKKSQYYLVWCGILSAAYVPRGIEGKEEATNRVIYTVIA